MDELGRPGENRSEPCASARGTHEGGNVDPLEQLRQEHETALLVTRATRRILEEADASGRLDTGRAEAVLDFLRYFTNACHTPKEEDLLFTALSRHGLSWDEPPLRDLVRQHADLRALLDGASDALASPGAPGSLARATRDLRAAVDLFEAHVELEERALFPLAGERLHRRDLDGLEAAFSGIACDEQEEGVRDYYAGVARELAGAGV